MEFDETGTHSFSSESERDEVIEVKRLLKRQTVSIRQSQLLVLGSLIVTGFIVTYGAYQSLHQQEINSFILAFKQFSKTLGEAAVQQQESIRGAVEELSAILSIYVATSVQEDWPMATLPKYEFYARMAREKSGIEMVNVANIVKEEVRLEYLNYTNHHYEQWMKDSHQINSIDASSFQPLAYKNFISGLGFEPDITREVYYPLWTFSPPPVNYATVNWNVAALQDFAALSGALHALRNETVFTKVRGFSAFNEEQHSKLHGGTISPELKHPHSFGWQPIYRDAEDYGSEIVAVLSFVTAWDVALRGLIPEGVVGIQVIVRNTCGDAFTYALDGPEATFMGFVDDHDPRFSREGVHVDLGLHTHPNYSSTDGHCVYSMDIYPNEDFRSLYTTMKPEIFASLAALTFAFIAVAFLCSTLFVEKRNQQMTLNAARSNAIVTAMIPAHLRDKLIGDNARVEDGTKRNLKSFLTNGETDDDSGAKPLADLFLETTVMFAGSFQAADHYATLICIPLDIAGFTAWSSVREPLQVFILLETIFASFDTLAKRYRVFKVETVGDCYVAIAGVPQPQKDHAEIMCRFARSILTQMKRMTRQLEVKLGPETDKLNLRIGIHSGPVTGGILRGERSRFQLFGDTMNTTARLESSGKTGMIHLSKATADLLIRGGKGHWITERECAVVAKGKGTLETYWLKHSLTRCEDESEYQTNTGSSSDENSLEGFDNGNGRLISWSINSLAEMLTQVVEGRASGRKHNMSLCEISKWHHPKGKSFLTDVAEVIPIGADKNRASGLSSTIGLSSEAKAQLSKYVRKIASMYRKNAFHSFAHATHVLMSVKKLMSRIIAPTDWEEISQAKTLHDFTYGINSSPLTQFACAFSALIHDVDHDGVTNTQLIKENHPVAELYERRSPAEQNSLELAWNLLLMEEFSDLRVAIAPTAEDLSHFRQLVLNIVLATDIADAGLKELRNNRWKVAFSKDDKTKEDINRKATIVVEHLIQASDVSHTMQHWHVYRKWNQAFFEENWHAYKQGRAEKDPAEYWYKGEIGFFDFYIIPLAKKLKDCGVFGVSSDEFLDYALQNRREWEQRGQEVVSEMSEDLQRKYGADPELRDSAEYIEF